MDAIAGLFERNDQGRFAELRRYFDGQPAPDRSKLEIEEDLRRLVQSAVTDWLFEAYRAADRSLSNQIRALKRSIDQREDVQLQRRGTVQWVEVVGGAEEVSSAGGSQVAEARRPGRPMPLRTMEAHLASAVAAASSTGDLLDAALDALAGHPDYEGEYPLTRLAQAMRAARVRVQAVTEHSGTSVGPERPLLRPDETERYIERTLKALRTEKRATYVEQDKLTEQAYAAYFRALHDRLTARFVPPGDPEMTHFDALSEHLPLEKEEYRAEHRARFEYLERQAREALIDRLKEVV